jgi:hypothetical protein
MEIDSSDSPRAVGSRWPGSWTKRVLIALCSAMARPWLGVIRRSFMGMSRWTTPPLRIQPVRRSIVSRPTAPGSAKGLMNRGPLASASAAGVRLPVGGSMREPMSGRAAGTSSVV